jgi:hypothetical protein
VRDQGRVDGAGREYRGRARTGTLGSGLSCVSARRYRRASPGGRWDAWEGREESRQRHAHVPRCLSANGVFNRVDVLAFDAAEFIVWACASRRLPAKIDGIDAAPRLRRNGLQRAVLALAPLNALPRGDVLAPDCSRYHSVTSLERYPFYGYTQSMPKVQVWGYRCERCGHAWLPRKPEPGQPEREPRTCPKCKSPYWNVPRKQKLEPKD